MTPGLLLPMALAALLALAIPVVIHISRRTESRVIDFAALRWLTPSPRPRRRPRIEERRLLLLRLLLLAALALWLARPVLWDAQDARPVIAVEPGVDPAPIIGAAPREARLVWLAPGFPSLDHAPPQASAPAVSLIRQLDAELSPDAPLDVVVPPVLEEADAERPRLTRPVNWRVSDQAIRAEPPAPAAAPALTVRHSAEARDGVRYIRAAATAWDSPDAEPRLDLAAIDQPLAPETRHLVWLAAGPLPETVADWIKDGGMALLSHDVRLDLHAPTATVWSDAGGRPLATVGAYGRGRVVQFTRPLEPAAMPQLLDADFPDVLERLLVPPAPPTRVAAAEHAPLVGARAYALPPLDIRPWLALLIALMFAAERWLATSARRGAAP
jgi:hypothetical protein